MALKEIRLNTEEGTPFTAIREGTCIYVCVLVSSETKYFVVVRGCSIGKSTLTEEP